MCEVSKQRRLELVEGKRRALLVARATIYMARGEGDGCREGGQAVSTRVDQHLGGGDSGRMAGEGMVDGDVMQARRRAVAGGEESRRSAVTLPGDARDKRMEKRAACIPGRDEEVT